MPYVDGFLLAVPTARLAEYRRIARQACKVWLEHGALEYRECAGDDLALPGVLPFPKVIKAKADETVIFAWITYQSKAHRNRVNKLAMNDPRLKCMDPAKLPFDCKRMACGGFKVIVSS
jgi:alkaline phosphatase